MGTWRGWYVLAVFSLVSMSQSMAWFVFSSVPASAAAFFALSEAELALLLNWGSIVYVAAALPLLAALATASPVALRRVLRAGAAPDTEDQWGQTPLVTARRHHFARDARNAALFAALEGRLDADALDALVRDELSRCGASSSGASASTLDSSSATLFGTPASSDHRDDDDDVPATTSTSSFFPNNSRAEKSV